MCGSAEPHPYPVRSFTYRNEQIRTADVQRVIVYIMDLSAAGSDVAGWIYLARGIIVSYGRLFYTEAICVLINVLTKLKNLLADVNLLCSVCVCFTCQHNI